MLFTPAKKKQINKIHYPSPGFSEHKYQHVTKNFPLVTNTTPIHLLFGLPFIMTHVFTIQNVQHTFFREVNFTPTISLLPSCGRSLIC